MVILNGHCFQQKKHMDESKTNVNVKLSNKTLKKGSNRKFYSYGNPTSIANYQIVTSTTLQSRRLNNLASWSCWCHNVCLEQEL
jgi:hypothetical protein